MYPADKVSHNKNLLGRRHVWEVRGRVERWGEEEGGQGEEGNGNVTIVANHIHGRG